jgi:DNA-binding transcriptional ArsR family regulator
MELSECKTFAKIVRALGSESATRIFLLLSSRGELCVSDVADGIRLSLSATSHQLQRMEAAGLLRSRRDGRIVCYTLARNRLARDLSRCLERAILERSISYQ